MMVLRTCSRSMSLRNSVPTIPSSLMNLERIRAIGSLFETSRGYRTMTPQEKSTFKGWFPSLNVDAAVVTGEATRVYNCISWTVGVTDRWIWPGSSIANFDNFYRQYGFTRVGNGPVAAWGISNANMTHGCVSGSNHGPRWESKCGGSLRIQHGLGELESPSYGHVVAFYGKTRLASNFVAERKSGEKLLSLSSPEKALLEENVAAVPKDVQIAFEKTFGAWKKTWFADNLSIDSNPYSRMHSQEFRDLIKLGSQVIPLVVEKLTHEENFFGVVVYDALQSEKRLIVQHEPDDPRLLNGEQGRAALIVKTWLAR